MNNLSSMAATNFSREPRLLSSGWETDMNSDDAMNECRLQQKVLYGLPCAKCRTYYLAKLPRCPLCKCPERVPARPTASPNIDRLTGF
jgi:hypothetical protein